ncbi:vanadium-dependent haloperoxidase [Streptomyces zingiberis]|uniref:Vanadium-dependent haloperoxidase n=1 Tax=Streptomyces zingiberis TaxID=2053010 RepID=A0ABX1C3X6_9ACTN|nr:vanadium-dependent haloperoxidase [Streptomyces zingiberis]NJQ01624.1 vanadium-dependent haloperoxidase [Streptomyces zingiberis]
MSRTTPRRRSLLTSAAATVALAAFATAVPAVQAGAAETAPSASPASGDLDFARGANDHVLYWNTALMDLFRHRGGTPGPLGRGGAMMDLAVYDAVNSVRTIGKPYLTKDPAAAGRYGALNSAIDHAAYTALRDAFPDHPVADLDAKLRTARAMPDPGTAAERDLGRDLGVRTARAVIADRAGDGSGDTTPYVPNLAPGHWRPAEGKPAGAPNWGKVKPFALSSGSQFRPGTIGGFGSAEEMLRSPEYAAQVNEIKRIGGRDSSGRTAEQTEIGHYWANDIDGTYKPIGQQYDHTVAVFRTHRPQGTSFESAKLFALTSVALADAAIAVWDSKYLTDWDVWRPADAIRRADEVPNPDIVADPDWEPQEQDLLGNSFSPNFPSYVSGHTGIAAAWARIVAKYFGTDDLAFTAGTDDPLAQGVTRSFTSLSGAAREKADSRKYLGIHFQWDNDAGFTLGTKVSDRVFATVAN